MLSKAYKEGLTKDDIWKLPPDMHSEQYARAAAAAWEEQQHKSRPMIRTIYQVIKDEYFWRMLTLRIVRLVLTFVHPFMLRWMLNYIVTPQDYAWWYGYGLAVGVAAVAAAMALLVHMYYWIGVRCALTVRGLVITTLFRKSLRMTLADKREHPPGTIVNLASVDADNLMNFCWSGMHDIWCNPLTIVLSLAFLLQVVGPASLVGVAILCVTLLSSGALSRLKSKLEAASLQACDERMRLMNEILGGMKLLKLYAWEDHFAAKVAAVRKRQHRLVRLSSIVGSLNRFVSATAPLLVSLGTFGTYIFLGHKLDAPTAFTALVLFNSLKEPLAKSPETVDLMVRSLLSIRRIQRVLLLRDREDYTQPLPQDQGQEQGQPRDGAGAGAETVGASIVDGCFDWGEPSSAAKDTAAEGRKPRKASVGAALAEDADEDEEMEDFIEQHQGGSDMSAALALAGEEDDDDGEDGEEKDGSSAPLAPSPTGPASPSSPGGGGEEDGKSVRPAQRGRKTRKVKDSKEHGAHMALSTEEPEDEDGDGAGEVDLESAASVVRPSSREVQGARAAANRRRRARRAAREREYAIINASMRRNPSFGSMGSLAGGSAEVAENRARAIRVARAMADDDAADGAGAVPRVVLRDITVKFPKDKLTIIVGPVGSGKSSLLGCLIAEMRKLSGTVTVPARTSYTPQQSWMLNDTLRENICFGFPFQADRFTSVVAACALAKDLAGMPYRDLTEIGENGLNLSGGQKQRIALARAAYARADLVLLDDPLSAVDAHVGKWLFERCICNRGLLRGTTRVLVTHQLQFVRGADWVIVMKDGQIQHQGTYQELLSRGLQFEAFVEQAKSAPIDGVDSSPVALSSPSSSLSSPESASSSPQTSEAPLASPPPQTAISPRLPRACDDDDLPARVGAHRHSSADLTPTAASAALPAPSLAANGQTPASPSGDGVVSHKEVDVELGLSAEEEAEAHREAAAVISLEGKAAPAVGQGNLTQAETAREGTVAATVYWSYIRACGGVGLVALFTALFATSQAASVLSDLTLADWSNHKKEVSESSYVLRYGVLVGIAGVLFLVRVLAVAGSTTRASKRLHDDLFKGLMRAPLSFFDSTPSGRVLNRCSKDQEIADSTLPGVIQDIFACTVTVLGTVLLICYLAPVAIFPIIAVAAFFFFVQVYYLRASRVLKRGESTSRSPMYSHVTECLNGITTIRAYKHQTRFEQECYATVDANVRYYFYSFAVNRWLGVRTEIIAVAVVFVASVIALFLRDQLGAGLVGLAVTSTLSLSASLNWMVRQFSEFEVQMNAVDRILEYAAVTPEAPFIVPDKRPPPNWPSKGEIELRSLTLKYRPDLRPVLDRLSVRLRPAEKIGIVGRTGAGKSTLTLALFRIVEAAGGSVWIDGVDIGSIGLRDLRSRLAIIPQDPVLFAGTLRSNLDPFNKATDDELWSHLDRVHLRDKVAALPGKLSHHVEENGDNFSVGERQLLCLGRALARKSKIVIMDEASASLDFATDMLVRELVQREFGHCTVLTIAHRLNTVLNSHRIMVLEQGRLVEFDTPEALAALPNGHFAGLLRDAHESAGQGQHLRSTSSSSSSSSSSGSPTPALPGLSPGAGSASAALSVSPLPVSSSA